MRASHFYSIMTAAKCLRSLHSTLKHQPLTSLHLKSSPFRISVSNRFHLNLIHNRLYNRPWSRSPMNNSLSDFNPQRAFKNLPKVVRNIIYLNCSVYGLHLLFPRFTFENFTLKDWDFDHQRYHTIFTSTISHKSLMHLFFNMLMLYFWGPYTLSYLTVRQFCLLYFGSGICGSLTAKQFLSPNECVLGASASIFSLMTFLTLKMPHTSVLFFGLIPMKLWHLTAFISAFELYSVLRKNRRYERGMHDMTSLSGISHEAHLTGISCGVAFFYANLMGFL